MQHVYRIVQSRKYGLDLWLITKDGRPIHSFFSEGYARTIFERIKQACGRGEVY